MPMHTKIREAVERVGAERVLYGSDAPFHHPAVEQLKVRLSGLATDRHGAGARRERRRALPPCAGTHMTVLASSRVPGRHMT